MLFGPGLHNPPGGAALRSNLIKAHLLRMAAQIQSLDRYKTAAASAVFLIHVVLLWTIVRSLNTSVPDQPVREIQVSFPKQAAVIAKPPIPDVELPIVMPPVIDIAQDTAPATGAASAFMVLAPRPDPVHPNAPPTVTLKGFAAGAQLRMIANLEVSADGTIQGVDVVSSSGNREADASAIGFIKTHWRLLPAMLGNIAIKYSTTVAVVIAVVP